MAYRLLSSYETHSLQKIIDEIKKQKTTKEAFIYFNNDIDASAIMNAKKMIDLSKSR
ncbi:MAG: DUF72 domain-containing protein [Ginsengibacter sp.]